MTLHRYFLSLLITIGLLVVPLASQAQIIIIPDCDEEPQDPFCQEQCDFDPTLPWCAPPEPERDPIVLIPGITVSQNKKLLYRDEEGGKWKFAFLFNVYKGLINKLESAGYEEGEDLLIAHYDWRNPAVHNATTYLKPIIDQAKQNTGAGKVDVVAHSFGGVVIRTYIQSDDYENDIDQLITLGSPHEGAADAYVAWEGGIYPEGWKFWIKKRVENVEEALRKTRNQPDIRRPESFRSFFPSLHDMLPLNDFVRKDNTLLAITDLTEQNSWLKNLHDTFSDIATKGINLATIAGTNVATLGQVNITNERTSEDEKLGRWRDGHARPEPPPLNSTDGDARVLLSNAHIGSENVTIDNAVHHKLPDEAQDQVFELLGLEPEPSFFSDFPEKIFGIVILSPLEVTIEGPNGEVLSLDQNTFGEDMAEYDDDPSDPDDPIEINIADPPDGDYTITYTGTDQGEYTIITSYADENETTSSVTEGATEPGEVMTETVTINDETSSLVDDEDYHALLKKILTLAKQAKHDNAITGREFANIAQRAKRAQANLRLYERFTDRGRDRLASFWLKRYYRNINRIKQQAERIAEGLPRRPRGRAHIDEQARADFADEVLQLVGKIKHYSPPL